MYRTVFVCLLDDTAPKLSGNGVLICLAMDFVYVLFSTFLHLFTGADNWERYHPFVYRKNRYSRKVNLLFKSLLSTGQW